MRDVLILKKGIHDDLTTSTIGAPPTAARFAVASLINGKRSKPHSRIQAAASIQLPGSEDERATVSGPGILIDVPLEHLQRVHRALRITQPLEEVSPLLLSTLTMIAHCWRDRIPDHLFRDEIAACRVPASGVQVVDVKRRAAGDQD